MYYYQIIASTLGLFIGSLCAYKTNISTEIFILSFILFIIGLILRKVKALKTHKKDISFSVLICLLFFLSFGIFIGQYYIYKEREKEQQFYSYLSDLKKNKQDYLEVKVQKIKQKENSQELVGVTSFKEVDFKIKIVTQRLPEYKVGDILKVNKEDGRENDRIVLDIDKLKDVSYSLYFPKVIKLGETEQNKNLYIYLESFKNQTIQSLQDNLPLRTAALNAGVLLGVSDLFLKSDIDNFRVAGLSHIIVLSGYNIAIVISLISSLLYFLSFKKRVFFTIFSIILFILFVGPEASIVRAGIMGSTMILAGSFGRQYVARQALFISVFIMIILSPKSAALDISFHLSFLATFGILYLLPLIEKYSFLKYQFLEKEKEINLSFFQKIFKALISIFNTTLAAQIFVTPYLFFVFGKISLLGIISNLFAIPVIGIIMLLGTIIIILSFIFPFIIPPFAFINFVLSNYVFYVAEYFGSNVSYQVVSKISFALMCYIYLIYIIIIYFLYEREALEND